LALAKLVLQRLESAFLLGNQQQAARFPVQPVHQFQQPGLRPSLSQLLDDAKAHATATMHRHTGRFVDGQKGVVLEHQRKVARRGGLATFSCARSESRIGGIRNTSPAATRSSATARPLFRRTSPDRMIR
jgi:hypothetical protein